MPWDDAGVEEPAEVARDAAAMLRRVLDAVERGELDAKGGRAVASMRQIEGAVAALEAVGRASLPLKDEPRKRQP